MLCRNIDVSLVNALYLTVVHIVTSLLITRHVTVYNRLLFNYRHNHHEYQRRKKTSLIKTITITRNTFRRTRSLSNATFSFLITWRSPSSKSAAVYKISSKSDDFLFRYGDISILKMAAVRHLGIVYYHTRPPTKSLLLAAQLPVKFHVNLIHRSEDIAIWIFRIFNRNAYSGSQNGGFGVPKCDYLSSRPQKGTSLRKSASLKGCL